MVEKLTPELSDDDKPYDWLYDRDTPLPPSIESQKIRAEITATQQDNGVELLGKFVTRHVVDGTLEAHGINRRKTEPPIGGSSHDSGNIKLFPSKGYEGTRRKGKQSS